MKEMNISVRAVAKKSGIDSSYLSKILNEKRNPPGEEKIISKIAEALNISPEYLTISCGKIPSRWQNFFLNAGIEKIRAAIENYSPAAEKERKREPEPRKIKIRRPTLPDDIL